MQVGRIPSQSDAILVVISAIKIQVALVESFLMLDNELSVFY